MRRPSLAREGRTPTGPWTDPELRSGVKKQSSAHQPIIPARQYSVVIPWSNPFGSTRSSQEAALGDGKIFGVGLNKTGTKSLEAAVEILGFTTGDTGKQTSSLMLRALEEGRPLLDFCPSRVAAADAYFDCRPIEQNFDVVDRQYPGSRFILHTRNMEDWLDSREKHVLRNQRAAAQGVYHGSWLKVDRQAWIREWNEHHRRVRDYFAGRDDFLEFDIAAGDGWDKLAPFLGCPTPNVPIPWENVASAAHLDQSTIAVLLSRIGSSFRRS